MDHFPHEDRFETQRTLWTKTLLEKQLLDQRIQLP